MLLPGSRYEWTSCPQELSPRSLQWLVWPCPWHPCPWHPFFIGRYPKTLLTSCSWSTPLLTFSLLWTPPMLCWVRRCSKVGEATPRRWEQHCLCGAWEAMWDIGSCSFNLWRSLGPTSNIWPVFSSTCCVLSSNLPESEPMRCLHQDFQRFKVNRIFLMIWTIRGLQFGC